MAQISYKNVVTDCADAYRTATSTTDKIQVGQLATKISKLGTSAPINATIAQYKAATTDISANTFVEFVNTASNYKATTLTQYDSGVSAVAMSGDTVLVYDGQYMAIGKVSGGDITFGSGKYLDTLIRHKIVKLDDTSFALIGAYDPSGTHRNYRLQVQYYTFDGTTITGGVSKTTTFSSGADIYDGNIINAFLADTNKIIISNLHDNSYFYSTLIICTVTSSEITFQTYNMKDQNYAGLHNAFCKLPDGRIFMPCTINGYALGYKLFGLSSTGFSSYSYGDLITTNSCAKGGISCVSLGNNNILIIHQKDNTASGMLYAVVATISGTTVSLGADTYIGPAGYMNKNNVIAYNGEYIVGVSGNSSSNNNKYLVKIKVSGTTVSLDKTTTISDGTYSAQWNGNELLNLDNGYLFCFGQYNKGVYTYGEFVAGITASTSKINGLTKGACTTTTAGDVYILS